jgi:hypothetical protein
MGTVTSVVTVRMKKGKNCPWAESATEGCSAEVETHLLVVVVVGPGHCARRSSRGGMEMCLKRVERK